MRSITLLTESQRSNITKWAVLLQNQADSGLSVTEWCRMNDINRKTLYYWKGKLTQYLQQYDMSALTVPEKSEDMTFVQIPSVSAPEDGTLEITRGDLHVSIPVSASADLIRTVIGAVKSC